MPVIKPIGGPFAKDSKKGTRERGDKKTEGECANDYKLHTERLMDKNKEK
jgi:hypothetical protein